MFFGLRGCGGQGGGCRGLGLQGGLVFIVFKSLAFKDDKDFSDQTVLDFRSWRISTAHLHTNVHPVSGVRAREFAHPSACVSSYDCTVSLVVCGTCPSHLHVDTHGLPTAHLSAHLRTGFDGIARLLG